MNSNIVNIPNLNLPTSSYVTIIQFILNSMNSTNPLAFTERESRHI